MVDIEEQLQTSNKEVKDVAEKMNLVVQMLKEMQ
jgi:hypothetical protein